MGCTEFAVASGHACLRLYLFEDMFSEIELGQWHALLYADVDFV